MADASSEWWDRVNNWVNLCVPSGCLIGEMISSFFLIPRRRGSFVKHQIFRSREKFDSIFVYLNRYIFPVNDVLKINTRTECILKLSVQFGGSFGTRSSGVISILKFIQIITNKINRRHVLHEMFTLLMSLIYVKLNSNLSFRKYRSLGEFVVLPYLRKSRELFYLQLLPLHLSIYYLQYSLPYIFFLKCCN